MKIRKLQPNRIETKKEEPLIVVRESLDQMEQILNEHFVENEVEEEGNFQKGSEWWQRLFNWIKSWPNVILNNSHVE